MPSVVDFVAGVFCSVGEKIWLFFLDNRKKHYHERVR
jgi:hypothetical protein